MCFSASVSLQTYIVGMIGSFMLWQKGYTALAGFYATVIQMQLVEFVLWTQQQGCSSLNAAATRAGILINHLEPLVLYGCIAATTSLPVPVHILAALYTCMTLKYSWKVLSGPACTKTYSNHLEWTWNYQDGYDLHYALFLALVVSVSMYGIPQPVGTWHAGIVIVTFLISKHMYGTEKATGAMWCFFAAFVPIVLVMLVPK